MRLLHEYDANEISFACIFLFVSYVLCTVVVVVFAFAMLKMYLGIVALSLF